MLRGVLRFPLNFIRNIKWELSQSCCNFLLTCHLNFASDIMDTFLFFLTHGHFRHASLFIEDATVIPSTFTWQACLS